MTGLKNTDPDKHLHGKQAKNKSHTTVNQILQQPVGALLLGQQVEKFTPVGCGSLLEVVRQQARQRRQQLGISGRLGLKLRE